MPPHTLGRCRLCACSEKRLGSALQSSIGRNRQLLSERKGKGFRTQCIGIRSHLAPCCDCAYRFPVPTRRFHRDGRSGARRGTRALAPHGAGGRRLSGRTARAVAAAHQQHRRAGGEQPACRAHVGGGRRGEHRGRRGWQAPPDLVELPAACEPECAQRLPARHRDRGARRPLRQGHRTLGLLVGTSRLQP